MQGSVLERENMTTANAVSAESLLEVGIYQYLQAKGYKKSVRKFLKEASQLGDDLESLPPVMLTVNQKDDKKERKEKGEEEVKEDKERKSKKQKTEAEDDKLVVEQKKHKAQASQAEEKKPFQRVDPSKVEFLDERLRTNDYLEFKPSSYGDKAYAALAPTKGADFRKEKNKKKKATYKGGQINTSTIHSIKFSNSSDDE